MTSSNWIYGDEMLTFMQEKFKAKGLPIAFCCGSTWDSGPTGTHTFTEYEEWLKTNPNWSAEIID